MNAATTNAATTSAKPCRFFQKGACAAGNNCPFQHVAAPSAQVASTVVTSAATTNAATTNAATTNAAVAAVAAVAASTVAKKPCHFFLKAGGCASGDKCQYSHDAGATAQTKGLQKGPKDGKPPKTSEQLLQLALTMASREGNFARVAAIGVELARK